MKKHLLAAIVAMIMVVAMVPFAMAEENVVTPEQPTTLPNDTYYRYGDTAEAPLTEDELAEINGVSLHGIADFNGAIFSSMEEAYTAISNKLTTNGGLEQEGLADDAFNVLYTDRIAEDEHSGVSLTWTIFGDVEFSADLNTYYLSGGRAAAWYGSDEKTIRYIYVVGYDDSATVTIRKNPTMPYQWWGGTTDSYIGIFFNRLTINDEVVGNDGGRPGFLVYCPTNKSFDLTMKQCTVNGRLYHYFNGEGSVTINDCTFNGSQEDQSAFMAQGHTTEPLTIQFTNNTVSGYERGINIDQATADVTISNNTITPGVGYSAIQLAGFAEATIENNTIYNQGDFLTFHANLVQSTVADRTVSVTNNEIYAVDGIQGYLIYDDIKAEGHTDESYFTINWENNDVDESIITSQGIKGTSIFNLSDSLSESLGTDVIKAAQIGDTVYTSLPEAVAAAEAGDTIILMENVMLESPITLPAGVTLDGAGKSITYTNSTETVTNGALITAESSQDNVTIKNVTINATGIKHGVQFYCNNGGTLENVTINGAEWTSVQVNGATNVTMTNCVLNPGTNAYTNIEYSMGVGVTTIPSMTITNVSGDVANGLRPMIWVDEDTVANIRNTMGGTSITDSDVQNRVLDSITNNSYGDLAIAFRFEKNGTIVTDEVDGIVYIPPVPSYRVTIGDTANGTVTASPATARQGATVTLTVTPEEGYAVDELTVTDFFGSRVEVSRNSNGTYSFVMPYSQVEVDVTFTRTEEPIRFTDVPEGAYYYDAVYWAVENGVTVGATATTFNPGGSCTRAQMVTFLWRAAGSPEPATTVNPFTDVDANDYYYEAVLWAVENGVTVGATATTFNPGGECTRAQMVTFLWRAAGEPGTGTSSNPFTDVDADDYYCEAVLWAVENGITVGDTATTFAPVAVCTRAQAVTFLYRDRV